MTQARQKTNNRGAGAAEILIQSLAKQQRQQKKTERKKKKTKNKEAKQSKTKKKLRFGCLCGVKNYFQSFNLYFFNLKTSYVIVVMKYPLHVA